MRFALGGKEYEFDETLSVKEAILLFEKTGLGVNEFDVALRKGNPLAIAAWILMLMQRSRVVARWEDVLELDIRTWKVIVDPVEVGESDAAEEADAAKVAPDPTRAGTTPGAGTSATS